MNQSIHLLSPLEIFDWNFSKFSITTKVFQMIKEGFFHMATFLSPKKERMTFFENLVYEIVHDKISLHILNNSHSDCDKQYSYLQWYQHPTPQNPPDDLELMDDDLLRSIGSQLFDEIVDEILHEEDVLEVHHLNEIQEKYCDT